LEEIVTAPVKKTETNDRGDPLRRPRNTSIRKSWDYFAKKRRSLGRYSSLADQSHGGFFFHPVACIVLLLETDGTTLQVKHANV
jgi:hypothetical protein